MGTFHLDSRGGHGGTAVSSMMRTSTTVTMGHAFGVSDERVQSTRRRDAEAWPIVCHSPEKG
jgi:hypothetical protein